MKENESKRKQIKKVKTKNEKDVNASNEKEEEKCQRKKFVIVLKASCGKKV